MAGQNRTLIWLCEFRPHFSCVHPLQRPTLIKQQTSAQKFTFRVRYETRICTVSYAN